MRAEHVDCVSPDRSPAELLALRGWLEVNSQTVQRTAEYYSILGGHTRLKILSLLRETGELCVCDLATVLEMTPAAVSQHLSRLRGGNLVKARRDGMTIYYHLDPTAERFLPASVPAAQLGSDSQG